MTMCRTAVVLLVGLTWSTLAEPVIKAPVGQITGVTEPFEGAEVESFKGIPFAKPPVGELRFAMPVPFGPVGDFEAKNFSSSCPQPNIFPMAGPQSEDCLYLNVYRKKGTKEGDDKAVMVMIHGGAFSLGSATMFDGVPLAGLEDMVVVAMNYRLGILGFADMKEAAPGNLGLFDQRLAMEWVQQNIKAFGGDPKRVTLFGVSAGSMSVSAQINTPLNRGKDFFQAAILDAGVMAPGIAATQDKSLEHLKDVAAKVNCQSSDNKELLACLRKADVKELVDASYDVEYSPSFTFQPTADGHFIPRYVAEDIRDNAKDFVKVPMLIGYAKDEGTMFAGYYFGKPEFPALETEEKFADWCTKLARGLATPIDMTDPTQRRNVIKAYYKSTPSHFLDAAEFVKDTVFVCPTNAFVESYAKHNKNVYVFQFERKLGVKPGFLPQADAGVYHSTPTAHMAGTVLRMAQLNPEYAPQMSEEDKRFVLDNMKMAADFAKNPEAPTLRGVRWPDYSTDHTYLKIDDTPTVAGPPLVNDERCDEVFPVYEGRSQSQA